MNPITGPLASTQQLGAAPGSSFYEELSRYRQAKPFDLPLPYRVVRRFSAHCSTAGSHPIYWPSHAGFNAYGSQGNADAWALPHSHRKLTDLMDDATNRARNKALAGISDLSDSWGESLGEYRQALGMMQLRCFSLASSFRAFKRGDWVEGVRVLNIDPNSLSKPGQPSYRGWTKWHPRRISRHAAAIWMEFHFGWSPTVSSIFNTLEFLTNQMPTGHLSVSSRKSDVYSYSAKAGTGSNPLRWKGQHNLTAWCRITTKWRISNPNLFLLNRMGLINPASIAWNLAKFSWFLGWVVNLEDVLNNWTDLYGLELTNPCYTRGCVDNCSSSYEQEYPAGELYEFISNTNSSLYNERKMGLPDAVLRVKNPFAKLSVSRGLTAISFLVQTGIKPKL